MNKDYKLFIAHAEHLITQVSNTSSNKIPEYLVLQIEQLLLEGFPDSAFVKAFNSLNKEHLSTREVNEILKAALRYSKFKVDFLADKNKAKE